MAEYPYKVASCSTSRTEHESKKSWLETQGVPFGKYALYSLPTRLIPIGPDYWRGLNFYWCFSDEGIAIMFKLVWGLG